MRTKNISILICIGAVILFCYGFLNPPSYKAFHIRGYAQGTTYTITYYSQYELITVKETDSLLSEIDSSLSIYNPASLISRFNSAVSGVKADKHMQQVVGRSLEIFHETKGIADITVQPLVEAWGFGPRKIVALPDSATIHSLLNCVGSGYISLKNDSLLKSKPCVRIDVNGIAQGYSVDVLARFMDKKGVNNYLVELGGEIRVRGHKQPGNQLMKIGIESPDSNRFEPESFKKVIRLQGGAITTSGNYRKYRENSSGKIAHLINPFTGYPFNNGMISVTVWARDAITADGFDNAIMGMGEEKAMHFLSHQKQLEAYLIYENEQGQVKDTATAGFYKLIEVKGSL